MSTLITQTERYAYNTIQYHTIQYKPLQEVDHYLAGDLINDLICMQVRMHAYTINIDSLRCSCLRH